MASRQESVGSTRIDRHVVLELVDGELVGAVVEEPLPDEAHIERPIDGQGGRSMTTTYEDRGTRGGSMDRNDAMRALMDKDGGETTPFFMTSEFMGYVLTVLAVAICAAVFDEINAWRGMLLITALTIGYLLSRGIAKAGTRYRHPLLDDDRRWSGR
jgi:hypothetical protein